VNVSLVITLIGPDRPGLVGAVSSAITQHEGNWLESRMVRLASKFAGVLHVSVPQANAEALEKSLQSLRSEGLVVNVERSDDGAAGETRRIRLEVIGNDRPGIVREVSRVLSQLGVNVDELSTGVKSAAMSGDLLFQANAELSLPVGVTTDQVRAALEGIAHDLMVDIALVDRNEA
jgi:glycine cleavage system regulatory protein